MAQEQGKSLEAILREILLEDRNILARRNDMLAQLAEKVPGSLTRDLTAIKNAMMKCNIGEMLLAADEGDEEKRSEALENAKKVLLDNGIQEKRAFYVVETFQKAMEWDKEPMEDSEEKLEEPVVPESASEDVEVEEPLPAESASVWTCVCGASNTGQFCTQCGQSKSGPAAPAPPKEEPASSAPVQEEQTQLMLPVREQPSFSSSPSVQGNAQAEQNRSDNSKIVLGFLIVALLVGLCFVAAREGIGTSPKEEGQYKPVAKQSESTNDEKKEEAKMTSDLSLGGMDLGLTVDQMHERLGKEKGVTQEGEYKFFLYDHVKVGVKDGIVDALVSVDSQAKTKRGLHEGSSYQDVTKAYGTDCAEMDYGDLILYEYTFQSIKGKQGLLRFAINKSDHRVNYISVRIPQEPEKPKVDEEGAKQAFINYHKAITDKNFQSAFNLMSADRRGRVESVEKFKGGYTTTISSVVDGLTIASSQPGQVVMYYKLIARDRMGNGHVKVQTFGGTATMIQENGRWVLDDAESKKTGERIE